MTLFIRSIAFWVLVAVVVAAPSVSRAEPAAPAVSDFTVFLDPPTGFVFVKLPAGWKFVGKVDAVDLARLPAGVVTALIADGEANDPGRLAARPAR